MPHPVQRSACGTERHLQEDRAIIIILRTETEPYGKETGQSVRALGVFSGLAGCCSATGTGIRTLLQGKQEWAKGRLPKIQRPKQVRLLHVSAVWQRRSAEGWQTCALEDRLGKNLLTQTLTIRRNRQDMYDP